MCHESHVPRFGCILAFIALEFEFFLHAFWDAPDQRKTLVNVTLWLSLKSAVIPKFKIPNKIWPVSQPARKLWLANLSQPLPVLHVSDEAGSARNIRRNWCYLHRSHMAKLHIFRRRNRYERRHRSKTGPHSIASRV